MDVLPKLVASYNASYHRSISMSPNKVNASNEDHVRQCLFPPKNKARRARWHFELGDRIRMTSSRRIYNPFEKGYVPKWTRELFVVRKRVSTTSLTYELSVEMGEPIKGKFYAQELQSVSPPESYRIEKIIRSQRRNDGKIRHYVRWLGYPKKFDSWIDEIHYQHQNGGSSGGT